jgi:hypothetical protein
VRRNLTSDERRALKIALEEEMGVQFHNMNTKLQHLLQEKVKPQLAQRTSSCNPAEIAPTTSLCQLPITNYQMASSK